MQFNLNRLISDLENCEDKDANIEFDFGRYPKIFGSWRGSYELPAVFWGGEEACTIPMSVGNFLFMCKETIGKQFTGYKGGEYVMNGTYRLWVCEFKNFSGNLGICGVLDLGYKVILNTEYCDY